MRAWQPLALGALLLFLSGCGDFTPCETDLDCVVLCSCANGVTATAGDFQCKPWGCGGGHIEARDCVDTCSRAGSRPVGAGDDDDSGPDDDDSGLDDDDSGGGS